MDGHPLTPSTWGSKGKGLGQFYLPENIAFDSKDEFLYVADSGNNRIQKFTTWGRNITSWGSLCDLHNPISCKTSNNSSEIGAGQFRYPQGLAVDFKGDVYVADFSNDRIQKFDSNGKFLKMWGSSCNLKNDRDDHCKDPDGEGPNQTGDGQFYRPKGIAVNPKSDEVYIVDKVNDRIQKFDSNGTFLSKWGSSGTGDGEFYAPEYIAIDPRDSTVYVGDENNDRIQKFDSNGTFLSKWGSSGTGIGQFHNPEGIGIDSRTGEIYVVDENNNRIQKFAPTANSYDSHQLP
jgi:DNA-binding beta-propeller fold protein YncE